MNHDILKNMQYHFKMVHIYPNKPLATLYDLDQFLYELYEKVSASSTALYNIKVSMLAELLLNEAIQQENFSGVKMLLKYAKCSGFVMRELFQKKKYEMIFTIASSGRVWGSAQHVLDITHSRPTPGVFSNEDEYLEWLSANKEL
jgi:hypothetical protein